MTSSSTVKVLAAAASFAVALSACTAGAVSSKTPPSTPPTAPPVSTLSVSHAATAHVVPTPPVTALPAGGHGSTADVPWSLVGPGWILATWAQHFGVPDSDAKTLYLVDPQGGRYNLGPAPTGGPLVDWSGDARRALFYAGHDLVVVDLATGYRTTIPMADPPGYAEVAFTKPKGRALLVGGYEYPQGGYQPVQRLDLTGSVQFTYPTAFPQTGSLFGTYAESPDGTELVFPGPNGLEVTTNSGQPIRFLPYPESSGCGLDRWWGQDQLLFSCPSGLSLEPVAGGAVTALTNPNEEGGYLDAWTIPSGTYVQAAACGTEWIDQLSAGGYPVRLTIPGAADSSTVRVLGTYQDKLAVVISTGCDAGSPGAPAQTVAWYSPSTNVTTPLLGTQVDGGYASDAVAYGYRP